MNKKLLQNISWLNLAKWLTLLLSLTLTILLILMIYNAAGGWIYGTQSWKTNSQFIFATDSQGNLLFDKNGDPLEIPDPSTWGPGAGQTRLKEVLIPLVGGGALGFAGVLLQKTTRNNLAEVSILGIGSINIMFIFIYASIFKGKTFDGSTVQNVLPIVTIFASLIGTMIIFAISRSKFANKNTFVIIGIALQLLFEGLSVVFVNPTKLSGTTEGKELWGNIKHYTMGIVDTKNTSWSLIIGAALGIASLIVIALFLRKKIDIYEASPALAVTLGIKTERLRFMVFTIVALIAGIEASLLGTVALLGLIAPSIARLIFRGNFAPMALASFIIGGIMVALASWISTNLLNSEFPAGILATAIATPYFVLLILRGK